ncbi:hypothetical protein HK405_011370 [Cladochytrium tenue]|nr:hypothetical protein HK405_011370 [Cladochytrium tenue]
MSRQRDGGGGGAACAGQPSRLHNQLLTQSLRPPPRARPLHWLPNIPCVLRDHFAQGRHSCYAGAAPLQPLVTKVSTGPLLETLKSWGAVPRRTKTCFVCPALLLRLQRAQLAQAPASTLENSGGYQLSPLAKRLQALFPEESVNDMHKSVGEVIQPFPNEDSNPFVDGNSSVASVTERLCRSILFAGAQEQYPNFRRWVQHWFQPWEIPEPGIFQVPPGIKALDEAGFLEVGKLLAACIYCLFEEYKVVKRSPESMGAEISRPDSAHSRICLGLGHVLLRAIKESVEKKTTKAFRSLVTTFEIFSRESLRCPGVLVAIFAILCSPWAVSILKDALAFSKDHPEVSQSILSVLSFLLTTSVHFSKGARTGRIHDLKNTLIQTTYQASMTTFVFISASAVVNVVLYVPWLRLVTTYILASSDNLEETGKKVRTLVHLVQQSFEGLKCAPRRLGVILPALRRMLSVLEVEYPEVAASFGMSDLEDLYDTSIKTDLDAGQLKGVGTPSRKEKVLAEPKRLLVDKLELLGAKEFGWLPSDDEVRCKIQEAISATSPTEHLETSQPAIGRSVKHAEIAVLSAFKIIDGVNIEVAFLNEERARPLSVGVLESMYEFAERGQLLNMRSIRDAKP